MIIRIEAMALGAAFALGLVVPRTPCRRNSPGAIATVKLCTFRGIVATRGRVSIGTLEARGAYVATVTTTTTTTTMMMM